MSEFNDAFLIIFLETILIVAVMIDLRTQKIPNLLTFPAAGSALTYHSIVSGFNGLLFSAGGLALGLGLLFIPYLLGGMGAGDAKLMGVVGGVVGAKAVIMAFLCTAFVGGIYALALIFVYRQHFKGFFKKQFDTWLAFVLMRKYIPDPVEINAKKPRLCYSLAITLGTSLYIIFEFSGYSFFN
jgi:prepilin peptidase CpaA